MNSSEYNKLIKKKIDFKKHMNNYFKEYNFVIQEKKEAENNVDKVLSKQIMTHLQDFFNKSSRNKVRKTVMNNKTRKHKGNKKSKTHKNH
jgi:hypothetical protein